MKKAHFFFILIILFSISLSGCYKIETSSGPVINYTSISGELNGTLTLSGSPYAITEDSYVPANSTWKIEPGVEVRFADFYRLTVDGVIEAIGTMEQPITFGSTYYNNQVDRGNWEGILLNNKNEPSIFEFCIIEDGCTYVQEDDTTGALRGAIHCNGASPIIQKCVLAENGFNAVYVDSGGAPLIEGCTITENAFSGLAMSGASHPIIKNSIIVTNDDYGIVAVLFTSSSPIMEYCNIWDNFTQDIYGVDFDPTFWKGMISLDPQFINPLTANFHLESHSPCIDGGDPEDNLDPDGSKRDMGAFYYDQSDPSELRNGIGEKWDTLTVEYSPYRANADLWILEGETLVIEPGVIIEFNSVTELRFSFDIYGTLIAEGTEQNPIIIRSQGYENNSGEIIRYKGDWERFKFHSTSSGNVLDYVEVTQATEISFETNISATNCSFVDNKNPVTILTFDAQFESCTFMGNGFAGLILENLTNATTITHCVFYQNEGYGLSCTDHSNPVIKNNIFVQNQVHGIKCDVFSHPQIINNTIVNNDYKGIFAKTNSNPVIKNNIIFDNNKGGISCNQASNPLITFNDSYLNNYDSTMIVNQATGDTTWIIDNTGLDFDNCPNFVGEFDTTGLDIYNNFSSDPVFSDYQTFSLSPSSPCVNAGDDAAEYNDIDGSRNDLGAYGGPLGNWTPPDFIIDALISSCRHDSRYQISQK